MRRLAVVLVAALTATAANAAAEKLYRYRNSEGNVVVDYRVPAEYVSGGYEVINDEGVVLEIVPRELTPEEKEAAEVQRKLEEDARAEEERLRQWDESLLLRYSTAADIEAARERALDNLRIRMSILKGNRRSLKQKIENYQAQAAEIERSGREVDEKRLRIIRDMQQEIGATERAIADREREMDELADSFQMDIERFEKLQDMVDLRRSHGENR